MAYLPPTPYLGIALPDPATTQAFATTDVNSWFTVIDTKMGALDARVTATERDKSGTSAERDTFWGVPGSDAAKVALAARGARWFNTEKGWEEQYFAGTAMVGSGRFSRTTAGWYPSSSVSRVPIRPVTISGTGTMVRDGAAVQFTTALAVELQNVFTADFNEYEVFWVIDAASGDSDVNVQFLNGATSFASANYIYSGVETQTGAGPTRISGNPATMVNAGRTSTVGARGSFKLTNPAVAKTSYVAEADSIDRAGFMRQANGFVNLTNTFDGFRIQFGGTITGTGRIAIFGINDY